MTITRMARHGERPRNAMRKIFADSFYFLALANPRDGAHAQARAYQGGQLMRLVTTEFVLIEVADALARSAEGRRFAYALHDALRADDQVIIVPSDSLLYQQGLDLYAARPDKLWSLTDCISFVVMHREGIAEALTGDRHFEQAGFVALLKPA